MKNRSFTNRFTLLVFLLLSLNSCVVLDVLYRGIFEKGSYSYQYAGGKKKIDFRKGKWIIASYDQSDVVFFRKYLSDRLISLNSVKDKDGKLAYNFDLEFNVSEKELKQIRDLTNYDYLITLSNSSDNLERKWTKNDSYVNKRESSIVNIYSLSTGFLEYQITCIGQSDSDDSELFEIDPKYNLFNKIDRYAKH